MHGSSFVRDLHYLSVSVCGRFLGHNVDLTDDSECCVNGRNLGLHVESEMYFSLRALPCSTSHWKCWSI